MESYFTIIVYRFVQRRRHIYTKKRLLLYVANEAKYSNIKLYKNCCKLYLNLKRTVTANVT